LEPKITEFETGSKTAAEKIASLEKIIAEDVDARMKALNIDAPMKELVDKMQVLEKREWLAKHEESLRGKRTKGVSETPAPGGSGKVPASNGAPGQEEADKIAKHYRSLA